ncbi:hypothetical protein QWY85_00670 [Neolewinella lacunae]|uniref:Lipoprotein n=1 Tax=Neolewinella lacunae TaxID=1517758 RepID=A0A923PQ58_9BACT|nr:hypothetical protein [Neolewinella lacunae]MBC6995434.1 hypothetical protein [Neolewinella lacunae]MDN3633146.1 hypothetical protein [Neolewinella lacunae]
MKLIFLSLTLILYSCQRSASPVLPAEENGFFIFLSGDEHAIKQHGLAASTGLRVYSETPSISAPVVKSFRIRIVRGEKIIKSRYVSGNKFPSQFESYLENKALNGDKIIFDNVAAHINGSRLEFEDFFIRLSSR